MPRWSDVGLVSCYDEPGRRVDGAMLASERELWVGGS